MDAVNGTVVVPGTDPESPGDEPATGLEVYLRATSETRGQIVDQLAELVRTEQLLTDELARQLSEARARLSGYKRAFEALGGGAPAPKTAPDPTPEQPKGKRQPARDIPETKVKLVLARVRELAPRSPHNRDGVQMVTATYVARETKGLSPETASRALRVLRERETVRVAGAGRGGGVLYALMPEGDSAN